MTTATQNPTQLGRGLGWFSIGLGAAEIAAPGAVARFIGVKDDETSRKTLVALGVREIANGAALLTQPQSSSWAWTRVGGDLMDLALLGNAWNSAPRGRNRLAVATALVAGVTVLDMLAARRLGNGTNGGSATATRAGAAARGVHVIRAITVNRPPEEVYAFWRNLENLPRFMAHLQEVSVLDDRRSHWKADAPAGRSVEWDAEIIEDRPSEILAWRSLDGSDVPNRGSVRFSPAPGDRGTEVRVELRYDPPGGGLGAMVAKLFGEEPGQQVDGDLRRFKQVMEVGEVVRSDASIHRGRHPARPAPMPM